MRRAVNRADARCALAWLGAAFASVACSPSPARAPLAETNALVWRFEVNAGAGVSELAVEASFPPGTPSELGLESDAERFMRDVQVATDGGWRAVELVNGEVVTPDCPAHGCRIRYRFLLADAAHTVIDTDTAAVVGDAIEAPPSTWLLDPSGVTPKAYRLHVDPSVAFLSPLPPAADAADTYEALADDRMYAENGRGETAFASTARRASPGDLGTSWRQVVVRPAFAFEQTPFRPASFAAYILSSARGRRLWAQA